jgi:hypothetical protein
MLPLRAGRVFFVKIFRRHINASITVISRMNICSVGERIRVHRVVRVNALLDKYRVCIIREVNLSVVDHRSRRGKAAVSVPSISSRPRFNLQTSSNRSTSDGRHNEQHPITT